MNDHFNNYFKTYDAWYEPAMIAKSYGLTAEVMAEFFKQLNVTDADVSKAMAAALQEWDI